MRPLRQLGELALLDWIRKRAGGKKGIGGKNLLVGIGDDAAAFRLTPGKAALATSDMMVEGVHFDTRYYTPYQLGFKIVSVNASDIYAMGGVPRLALFTLAAPPETETGFIKKIFEGVLAALGLYGARLAGGDLSASHSGLVLDMTVIGEADEVIKRSGARVGDGVFVTGPLGDSACGLALLKEMAEPVAVEKGASARDKLKRLSRKWRSSLQWETVKPLVVRHLMPVAKRPPGRVLTAMLDISDGLLLDVSRLCKESGVGVRIYEDKIPVSGPMRRAAETLGLDPLALAKTGGEDYELLYTAPQGQKRKNMGRNKGGILIGEVIPAGRYMVDAAGKMKRFKAQGYEHFGK
ncbi:MAG: thiamine-phosphate kinase [Nitrospiraceae bacterium]|nr:thiamine-phosphate kinase [Nitrospiraceae bacterium]